MQLQPLQASGFMTSAIVPAVLISACALLLLGFNNRLVAVITRQRALHRELLQDARKQIAATRSWSVIAPPAHSAPPSRPQSFTGCKDVLNREELFAAEERSATVEWSRAIEKQVQDLRREAGLIRAAVSCLLAAILLFLVSGVVLAASTFAPHAEPPALLVFLGGLAAFALGVLLMLGESFLIISPVAKEEKQLRRIISGQSMQIQVV